MIESTCWLCLIDVGPWIDFQAWLALPHLASCPRCGQANEMNSAFACLLCGGSTSVVSHLQENWVAGNVAAVGHGTPDCGVA